MKSLAYAITSAGILLAAILGAKSTSLSFRSLRATCEINDFKSTTLSPPEARAAAGNDKSVDRSNSDIGQGTDLAALEAELADLQRETARQRPILEQERRLLADRRAMYDIGGKSYTFGELSEDAITRSNAFRALERTIEVKAKAVAQLCKAIRPAGLQVGKSHAGRTLDWSNPHTTSTAVDALDKALDGGSKTATMLGHE